GPLRPHRSGGRIDRRCRGALHGGGAAMGTRSCGGGDDLRRQSRDHPRIAQTWPRDAGDGRPHHWLRGDDAARYVAVIRCCNLLSDIKKRASHGATPVLRSGWRARPSALAGYSCGCCLPALTRFTVPQCEETRHAAYCSSFLRLSRRSAQTKETVCKRTNHFSPSSIKNLS